MEPTHTNVTSEGITLAVREYGERSAGVHLVLIHGFPDDQRIWEPVVEHLPPDWHVITYDVRGAGESSRPSGIEPYGVAHLADDFLAVLEASVPGNSRVHVAAHDWGSIAFWEVLAREGDEPLLRGRLASFTSASGPSLDHLGTMWDSPAGKRRLLKQALHSWYVWMFLLPAAPEFTWRRLQFLLRRVVTRIDPTMQSLPWGKEMADNAAAGVNLYRANVVSALLHPRPWRTNVPVRLVIAQQDGFVTPRSLEGLQARCRHLSRADVDAGHWHVRTQPDLMAGHIISQVRSQG